MPKCCTDCFLDSYLKDRIREEGELGKCTFCARENVYIIDPIELQHYFDPVINLYTAQVEFYPLHKLKECEGRFIWEILSEDWGIFDNWEKGKELIEEMYPRNHEDSPLFLDNYVDREDEWYGNDTKISDKLKEQWNDFCEEITHVNRFFPQTKVDLELMSEVLSYSENTIAEDRFLFRARLSPDGKKFDIDEIGAPPKEKAVEGRANPSWIPYLYLASNPDTAISEIRPQVNDTVSVGSFKLNKQAHIIDLRNPYIDTPFRWGNNLAFVLDIHHFLRMLGKILSKPVSRNRTTKEYLPSQYLCEFIKSNGFDGVLYRSDLGDGHNLVLFNSEKVVCTETKLYRVTSSKVTIEEVVD